MKSVFAFILGLFIAVSAQAQTLKPPKETAMDRFLRYVKIDTQSAEDQTTVPSTKKQLNLANLLAKELKELGAQNVRVSEFGIVYATVPGNLAGQFQSAGHRIHRAHGHLACRLRRKRECDHSQKLSGRRHRVAEGSDAGDHGREKSGT